MTFPPSVAKLFATLTMVNKLRVNFLGNLLKVLVCNIFIACILCLGIDGAVLATCAGADLLVTAQSVVNLRGEGRTIKEIIQDVALQSGYRIEISESLLDQKVSGEYVNTDIETFFSRILKGSDIFQIIDEKNKTIKLYVTARGQDRILVVEVGENGTANDYWLDLELDGEPGKTYKELLQDREEASRDYDPRENQLDGEPEKTTQDLLDEREVVFERYNPNDVELDGEQGKTSGDLLKAREDMTKTYNPAQHPLDGEPGKSTQDLLDERVEQFKDYDPNNQPLDGEPGKTFQELLDERDQVFRAQSN